MYHRQRDMEQLPPVVSASLGAMGSLAGKLDVLLDTELKAEIRKLGSNLWRLSEARDPPVKARIWMNDVRELSYDMDSCLDVAEPDWIQTMSGFKARVKEANEQHHRYMLGSISFCTDIATDFQISMVDGQRRPDLPVVGLDDRQFSKLREWLADDKAHKVASILGVGGIGKTTLAKQLWRERKPGGYFACRAFVRTAKKPDMRRILRSVLAQVRPHQPPDTNDVHELIHHIRQHLQGKRYFLIIDDLWATSVWDVARRAFPEGDGNKIVTTTEIKKVALACCSYQSEHIFNMEPLSLSHSRDLFISGVFGSGEQKSLQLDEGSGEIIREEKLRQLDEVFEEIIRTCAGLPLAIISLSSVLASQGGANTVQNSEKIQNNLPTNTTPAEVLKQVLNFCYNCLPSCLQTCLLYLSIYPENYMILKEDIIKQWVSEGFIVAPTENEKMRVARNYFDKLVSMGLIQHIYVDYSDEVLYYAVHHIVHDLITSKSREENFTTVIEYSDRAVGCSNKVSRLSLQFGSATYATIPESIGLSQVRSLSFIGLRSCYYSSILDFKVLRFLILHIWADQPSTGVDLKPTSELVLLRSLKVTCNKTVHLPDLMQGPKHLETLEINARVEAIPAKIVHLRSWLHLRLGVGTELTDLTGIHKNDTLNPAIVLDNSSIPPDSVTTMELLLPICGIPNWTGQLTNLCILKFVLGELQSDDINNLQGLPLLTVLSLDVQRPTTGPIGFGPGFFDALEYFEYRCGVLQLAFEEGAMPNLQRLRLGFNANRGEQYDDWVVGIQHLSNVKDISVIIGVGMGAEQRDFDDAQSAFMKAVGEHGRRIVSLKRADMVGELYIPGEKHHEIQGQEPSTSSEQPVGSPKLESQDLRAPAEKRHEIQEEHLSTSSEEPGSPTQESRDQMPEKQLSISSEQPRSPRQESPNLADPLEKQHEISPTQDIGSDSQFISRMPLPVPGAPSKKNKDSMLQQSAATPHKNEHTSEKERSMAYLAVVLARSVVERVLSKAKVASEEEAKLRQSAQHDLVFITGEFEMIYSFLKVLKVERAENEVARTWVRQVRELAYDMEDCIEFVIHLDKKSSWWFRMIPSCVAPPSPMDKALQEIEQLKGRVVDVSKRNTRYSLISDTGSKPVVVQQQLGDNTVVGCAVTTSNMLAKARGTAKRQQFLGSDLIQLITKEDDIDDHLQLQVISVWGAGGHPGTTSIINKTYTDPEICRNFTYRAWVKLMHPFKPYEFILSLMAQFYANSCKVYEKETIGMQVLNMMQAAPEDIMKDFVRLVADERYIVVLEGLSSMVVWDAITMFLPRTKNGSCIIVSTDQPEIASLCIGHSYQILELQHLSDEHSVCALFKKGSSADGYKEKKPMMEDSFLIGRESQMNELRKYLAIARISSSQVVSVWGIAGVGKSALVRCLYSHLCNDEDTRQPREKQFNKYCWVDVCYPFSLRDFCRSLLLEFHSEKDPINECLKLLKEHRCLIVIDGIQSKNEWDLIRTSLVSRSSRSVIIVITTDATIATYCANNKDLVFSVKGLEAAAAVDLFKEEVCRVNPSSFLGHHKEVEIEKLILKCGGLPKVIVAIADVLAKQTVTWMDTVHSLNQRFMHHLETKPEYDSLQDLFDWMHSYFHTCPDSLKPCIFYLSFFPRDRIIRRRRVVRRWIAEGYSRDGDEESAEENGEKQFSDLLDLSIIKQVPQLGTTTEFNDNKMALFQVNSFICEYIMPLCKEENLVFELRGRSALTTKRTGRHLIITDDWERDRIVFESMDLSPLRSLTVFGKWESFFISESMKLLRVLDLEDASRVEYDDLKKMVKWLRRLKFLSLRGHREIDHLPDNMDHLRQLQTLDVRSTSVLSLPENMVKLQKLQYIRAGIAAPSASVPPASCSWFCRCRPIVGVQVPIGIGKLTALHTLGVINVGASGGKAIVKELKKLTQLRKLGVSGINRHNNKEFFSAIEGHVHLESLSVRLSKDSQGCLDDFSLPWEKLQSLKLYGLNDKLPLSGDHHSKLTKLDLEMDTITNNDIEFLAKLPELSVLRLRVKQLQDGKLDFYAQMYGLQLAIFEKVKILEIACTSSKLHVTFGSKSMKNLELLKIDCSSALYQLTGLADLSELKQVLLLGADDETIKTQLESQLSKHPKRPAVKMEEAPRSS